MANHMAEIAKMLGVEIGERFKVLDDRGLTSEFDFYFSIDSLMIDYEEAQAYANSTLIELLRGDYSIKRKPCKPKHEDNYWYVDTCGCICAAVWSGNAIPNMYDINLYKLGNCYRTKKEAEANKEKWVKFYESDDVLEV